MHFAPTQAPTPTNPVNSPGARSPILAAIEIAEQLGQCHEVLTSNNCKALVSSLHMKHAELMRSLYSLSDENQRLQEQIKRYEQAPNVELRNGHYYTQNDGPFCTACFDTKRQLIRLSRLPENLTDMANFLCNVCNAQYI